MGTAKDGSGATSIWCLIVLAAKHLRKREFGTCWEIADPHRQTEARRCSLDFDGMYGGLFRGKKCQDVSSSTGTKIKFDECGAKADNRSPVRAT